MTSDKWRVTSGEQGPQFVSHAQGSVAELDTQLILALELDYCSEERGAEASGLLVDLRKMLNALRRTLEASRK